MQVVQSTALQLSPAAVFNAGAQIGLISELNSRHQWGITDADFSALADPPSVPDDQSIVVLKPWFSEPREALVRGIDAVCHVFRSDRYSWRRQRVIFTEDFFAHNLPVAYAGKHRPSTGLSWRVVNFFANRNVPSMIAHGNGRDLAGASALWALAHYPDFATTLNGVSNPEIFIGAYRLSPPHLRPGRGVMRMYANPYGQLVFGVGTDANHGKRTAVPTVQ